MRGGGGAVVLDAVSCLGHLIQCSRYASIRGSAEMSGRQGAKCSHHDKKITEKEYGEEQLSCPETWVRVRVRV